MNSAVEQNDYRLYRSDMMDQAEEYQDFVIEHMYRQGYPIAVYGSQRYQCSVGESIGGWEIKFDKKFRQSRNLYIEVAEKAHPRPGDYALAGILRDDNTVFYIIGDYNDIFVFPKRYLQLVLEQQPKWRALGIRMVETKTSKGILIPLELAKRWTAFDIHIYEDGRTECRRWEPPQWLIDTVKADRIALQQKAS